MTRWDVINIALRALGEPPSVGPDDPAPWVRRVANAFDATVETLLSEHSYNFAQMTLSLGGAVSPKPVGWEYGYAKPGDCLRILRVSRTDRRDDPGVPYEDRGGLILTNEVDAYLTYVSRAFVTREGAWPALFCQYVGHEIAAAVAPVTTQGEGIKDRIEAKAQDYKRRVKAWDSQQNPAWTPPPGRWIRARVAYNSRRFND